MENGSGQSPHIAILPSPGMGHLIPLAEFAKRLVLHHNFTVTFLTTADSSSKAQQAFLDALPDTVTSLTLPPVPLDDLPEDVKIETRISLTVRRSLPSLRDAVRSLKSTTRLVAFVADLFGTDTFDVVREFGVPPYVFFPSTMMALSLMFHLPTLHDSTTCEYRDLPDPVQAPGCVPVRVELWDPLSDRKNEAYTWLVYQARRYREAEGILVNSFEEIEPGPAKVLMEKEPGRPPVYPVGPLVQMDSSSGADGSGCLKWLDEQPRGSVLFVSFGSGGTLSSEQLNELAMGLEMSGQRFLWVIRSPSDTVSNAAFFGSDTVKDPFGFLPQGFLERTKNLGLVVPSWAPQIQVLSHDSTGGFLSHCGWNSTLESVVHGVPIIAWPLYAEQRLNAVMLVEDAKVALRPKAGENGVVGRDEISRVVKGLMEGEEGKVVRNRMRQLQEAGGKALSEEGSSYKALAGLATGWKNSNTV